MRNNNEQKFPSQFKVAVVREAINGYETLTELSNKYALNPETILQWKSEFLENVGKVFEKRSRKAREVETMFRQLCFRIDELKLEVAFLKGVAEKEITTGLGRKGLPRVPY